MIKIITREEKKEDNQDFLFLKSNGVEKNNTPETFYISCRFHLHQTRI